MSLKASTCLTPSVTQHLVLVGTALFYRIARRNASSLNEGGKGRESCWCAASS